MDPLVLFAVAAAVALLAAWAWRRNRRPASEKPLVALAYLLSEPRSLDESELRRAVTAAFGTVLRENDPEATEFVVGGAALPMKGLPEGAAQSFMVKVEAGFFLVNNFSLPYFTDPETLAEKIPDARIRKVITSHRAWLSVDALGETGADKAAAYRNIGRLMAQLAGPDCLGIFCPELQRCNEYDDRLCQTLASGDPLSLFEEPTFSPVLDVDGEDPRMQEAVAEARRRWPEFADAFRTKAETGKPFLVKAEFKHQDHAEFMWVSVARIDGGLIYGSLENTPNEIPGLREGQGVEVALGAVCDWMYVKGEEAVGGFTMKAIAEIQRDRGA